MSETQIIDISEVERSRINGWKLIEPNLSGEDAWKRGGKDLVDADVEHGVSRDLNSMSAGWIVDSRHYTYRYSEGKGQCVLLPIWEADYRYADNVYSASVDSWIGDVHWEDFPKDEKVEELKEKTDEEISSYKGLRTAGYVFFGIFSALTILFLALPSFSENRIAFCAMLVLAIVSWVLTRLAQSKKLNLENKLMNKLWDDKLIRSEAAERRFGIKVNIGEKPEKRTLELWVDIMVYVIFGIVFFIAITLGLFADINHNRQTRSQSNYQSSTTTTHNSRTSSSSYQQTTSSAYNSSQQTAVSSSGNGNTSSDAEIRQVLSQWAKYHNDKDVIRLASLYDNQVEYYQKNYSNNQVYNSKKKALEKNPQFQMEISNVRIDEYAAYCVVSFDKKIWLDPNKTPKTYPSYLHVEIIDDTWKIVTEGDLITDENLGKKDNNLKLLKVVNVEFNNSLAPQSGNTYYPSNLCDGNIATAWAINLDEAIYDDDKLFGPVFNVRCKKLSHIIIRNGYCKNDDSFRNNTRAAKIVFYNPDCYDRCILFDGSLRDTSAPQKLEISSNIEGEGNSNIKRIGMDFYTQNNGGFYKGAKWNDLCISEVEFWGYE